MGAALRSAAPHRGLVVELAGLPGAGKSTLAAATRVALLARGMPCTIADRPVSAAVPKPVRSARRLALAAAELARHPRRGVAAARAVRSAGPATARDELAGVVQWLAVQRLLARAHRRPGVHLVEEGPVQTLWTLGLRSAGGPPGPPAGDGPDLLVVVEAPLELVSARLAARRSVHSRSQRLGEAARLTELRHGRGLLDRLVEAADHESVVVANDGTTGRRDLGRLVAEWVLRAAPGCVGG